MTNEQFRTYTSKQILDAYNSVFNSVAGELVLHDLMTANHFFSPTVINNSSHIDPLQMALAEGERNSILRILTILENKGGYDDDADRHTGE